MNPIIKAQLDKVRTVKLPDYSDTTSQLVIPARTAQDPIVLEEGKCYIVQVENYILNPPEGFTLHTNWNNNKIPKHECMKVDVLKIMGKMIKVNSIGYNIECRTDTPDMWEGWLPEKSITVLERL